jgi:hypothetical protein
MKEQERAKLDLKLLGPYVDFLKGVVNRGKDTMPDGDSLCYLGEPLEQHDTIYTDRKIFNEDPLDKVKK